MAKKITAHQIKMNGLNKKWSNILWKHDCLWQFVREDTEFKS